MTVATKYVTLELIPTDCAGCGLTFGMPDGLQRHRRMDGKTFYCPVGHHNYYPRRKNLEARLKAAGNELEGQRRLLAAEERSHSATKGHLTRTKRRANAGVCLDCQRSFANVRRHRAKMHPEGLA